MKVKGIFKKSAAGILAAGLAAGALWTATPVRVLATSGQTADTEAAASNEEAMLVAALPENEESLRQETVYVITDAAGEQEKTIVNVWLKNQDEEKTLRDVARLSEIENLRGEETFETGENGEIIWAADGADIHYRGESEEALPVTFSVAFVLDEKAVTAEELAGADGHLKMTIACENRTMGEEDAVPFVVLSGFALSADIAKNVVVTGGRAIETADRTLVAGMFLPGVSERLAEEGEGFDAESLAALLPSEMVVEADVENFSLTTILAVADNSLLQEATQDTAPLLSFVSTLLGPEAGLAVMTAAAEDPSGGIGVFRSLIEAGKSYHTFCGDPKAESGTVRFIYRTGAIGE